MTIKILHGIGGSHAYGLNHEGSDEDHIGVISYPTKDFWNLSKPQQSVVGHEPYDYSFHELEKFLSLAVKSNPTVLEILYLDFYLEKESIWGDALVDIRQTFLSRKYVFDSFIGYAEQQFRRLMTRGNTSFSAGQTEGRAGKFGRHCIRLLNQGYHLYTTGEMKLRVEDPEYYRRISDMRPAELSDEFVKRWGEFTGAKSVLPEKPDWFRINAYLHDYRQAHV